MNKDEEKQNACVGRVGWGPIQTTTIPQQESMTYTAVGLRDQMAMAALQGLLATEAQLDTPLGEEADTLASAAYEYADAMLKAREK